MKVLNARCSSSFLMGLGSLLLATGLFACGGDSGTSPESSSSSSSSSAVTYAPPISDETAPVAIANFAATVSTDEVLLSGTVTIDDSKDNAVQAIDSIVFGVSPAGPVVSAKTWAQGSAAELSLVVDLAARIALRDFAECGSYTVYVTAYALGKARTDSATFAKPAATFCKDVSSSSSSATVTKALSSASLELVAQGVGSGLRGVDLDAMVTYSDVASMAAHAAEVDIIFGSVEVDGEMLAYLMTPNDADQVAEYVSIVPSTAYKGALFESTLASGTMVQSVDQFEYNPALKLQSLELSKDNFYVVQSDQYNATTQVGLFLVRVEGKYLSLGATATTPVTVWSVVQ